MSGKKNREGVGTPGWLAVQEKEVGPEYHHLTKRKIMKEKEQKENKKTKGTFCIGTPGREVGNQ